MRRTKDNRHRRIRHASKTPQYVLLLSCFFSIYCLHQVIEPNPLPIIDFLESSHYCIDDPNLIDFVILWVNGSDPTWFCKMKKAAKANRYHLEQEYFQERFIEHNELKYSLRSIEQFAPWVNKIYIITDNQYPNWINLSHPKLRIIDQSVLFYPGYHTFNSNTIQFSLYNIPNLSRRIVLMDDDYMFLNHVLPSDFFDENGKTVHHPRILNKMNPFQYIKYSFMNLQCKNNDTSSIFHTGIRRGHQVFYKRFHPKHKYHPPHYHLPIDMNVYLQMLSIPEAGDQFIKMPQFRICGDFQIHGFYLGYSFIFNHSVIGNDSDTFVVYRSYLTDELYQLKVKPKIFCMNEYNSTFYNEYLPSFFPNKSSYEL